MPGMDGPETLSRMKALENNLSAAAPVVSLTANAMSGAKEEYIRAGFKDYLTKPVNPQKLEDMLFHFIPPEKIRTVSGPGEKGGSEETAGLPSWLLKCTEVDAAEGLKNCSTKETYMIVLECFYEIIGENADEIEEYYRREDWENYTIKVHALKSSAKTIGAMSLSDQAAALEKAARSADVELIQRDTEALLERYRSLQEKLSGIATQTEEM